MGGRHGKTFFTGGCRSFAGSISVCAEGQGAFSQWGGKEYFRRRQAGGYFAQCLYKYKDSIFDADSSRDVTTVTATLLDESGALHDFLEEMYRAGASVVTINQSMPENGTAQVSVALRTGQMHMEVEQLLGRLRTHRTVVDVRRSTI